jgi:hypothetical protein
MENSSNTQTSPIWNRLLSKYSTIWIWSIIVGLNSGLTYTFYSFRVGNFGVQITTLLISFYLMAFTFSLFTWSRLYKILKYLILPTLFEDSESISKEIDYRRNEISRYFVSSAFKFLIVAMTFKFFAFVVELLMNALKS